MKRVEINNTYNGDCLEIMEGFPSKSVDLILCDPPYGIGYVDNIALYSYRQRGLEAETKPIINDSEGAIDWDTFFKQSYRILKDKKMLYFCCRTDMIISIAEFIKCSKFRYVHDFIWQKGDMGYGNLNIMGTTHELIIGLGKGKPEKSRSMCVEGKEKKRTPACYVGKLSRSEYYGHPTQKPVGMMAYIIQNRTDKGDLVLDPFAGIGSTLVAAKLFDRNYIGIELDENYCNRISQRLEDEEHIAIYKEMVDRGFSFVNSGITYNLAKPKEALTPAYLEWAYENLKSQSYGARLQKLIMRESNIKEKSDIADARFNNDHFEIKSSYLSKSRDYSFMQIRIWEKIKGFCFAIIDYESHFNLKLFYLTFDEMIEELNIRSYNTHTIPGEDKLYKINLPNKGQHWDRWISKYLVNGGSKNLLKAIYSNNKRGIQPNQTTIFSNNI